MHIGMQVRYCALGVSVTIRGSDGTVRNSHSWARAIERKLKMTRSYPLRCLTLVIIKSNQKTPAVYHSIPLDIHWSYEHGPMILLSLDVLGPCLLLHSKYPLLYVHLVIRLILYNGENSET